MGLPGQAGHASLYEAAQDSALTQPSSVGWGARPSGPSPVSGVRPGGAAFPIHPALSLSYALLWIPSRVGFTSWSDVLRTRRTKKRFFFCKHPDPGTNFCISVHSVKSLPSRLGPHSDKEGA